MILPLFLSLLCQAQPPQPTPVPPDKAAMLAEALGLPAGTEFEYEHVVEDGGSRERVDTSEGVGAGAEASGQTLSDSIDGSPPSANAGGNSAIGGGIVRDLAAKGFSPSSMMSNPFLWAGLAAVAFCVWFAKKREVKRAVMAGAVAVACFLAVAYPMVGVFALAGAILYLLAGSAIGQRTEAKVEAEASRLGSERIRALEALRAIAAGIEDKALPEDARAAVKARISIHADEADKDTIRAVKAADRL